MSTRIIDAKPCEMIRIGRLAENEAVTVRFSLTEFISTYGKGTAVIDAQRPKSKEVYRATDVTQDGDYLLWTLTGYDVAIAGHGRCVVRYSVGDQIAKSQMYSTLIAESLVNAEDATAGEVHDSVKVVLDKAEDISEQVKADADRATSAVSKIESSMDAIEQASKDAEEIKASLADASKIADEIHQSKTDAISAAEEYLGYIGEEYTE